MKFGHNLPRNQVPEWASAYIDYKGLKKLIKAAAQQAREGNSADLAGMSVFETWPFSRLTQAA
jgi:glycerophosphodiester phosphodiesterase